MQSQDSQISLSFLITTFALFAIAAWLRLAGTGWDEYASLHPDERHLLFVISEMASRFSDASEEMRSFPDVWFAAGQSPLDPHSTPGGLVYGEFPFLSMALLSIHLEISDWTQMLLMTRTITTLIDSFTILAVVMLAFELTKNHRTALLAGLLYAAAPTALQLANFYTVDTWLIAGFAWSGLLLFRLATSRSFPEMAAFGIASGAAIGFAIACKITALVLGLPVLLALMKHVSQRGWTRIILIGAITLTALLLSYRMLNPFVFSGPGFLGVSLSADALQELAEAHSISKSDGFPPNWQWDKGYNIVSFVRDFLLFGCGPVIGLALCAGLRLRKGSWRIWIPLSTCVPILAYSVFGQASALRYAAPALPTLAVLAAVAVSSLPYRRSLTIVAALLSLWWGSGVYLLHTSTHPRLDASRWIWTLPKGTAIANETSWDDALPVPLVLPSEQLRRWPSHDNHFELINLELTNPDTLEPDLKLVE